MQILMHMLHASRPYCTAQWDVSLAALGFVANTPRWVSVANGHCISCVLIRWLTFPLKRRLKQLNKKKSGKHQFQDLDCHNNHELLALLAGKIASYPYFALRKSPFSESQNLKLQETMFLNLNQNHFTYCHAFALQCKIGLMTLVCPPNLYLYVQIIESKLLPITEVCQRLS